MSVFPISMLRNQGPPEPGGVDWTTSTDAGGRAIVYGGGQFVVVGNTSTVYRSADGINWSTSTAPASGWTFVEYVNGLYIAGGTSSTHKLIYSTDAITWNSTGYPLSQNSPECISYGNGMYVSFINDNEYLTSTNLTSWTARIVGDVNSVLELSINHLIYEGGKFVAVGRNTSPPYATYNVLVSTNGTSWDVRTTPQGGVMRDVILANGKYVAVATGSAVYDSTDGLSWTLRNYVGGSHSLYGVAYHNGVWIAAGSGSTMTTRILGSNDGINWAFRSDGWFGGTTTWHGIAYGAGRFIMVTDNRISSSPHV